MSQFETPTWGEEYETDKWASDLFTSSNVKIKKPKKRKRNKYPKGFQKSDVSSEATVTEISSTSNSKLKKSGIAHQVPFLKNKKKKGSGGGSKINQKPSAKFQKSVKDASVKDNSSQGDKKKKKVKRIPQESSLIQSDIHKTALKTNKSTENSILKNSSSHDIQNSPPSKRKKKKGLNGIQNDLSEPPSKVSKLTENSTVKDNLSGSSAHESTSQLTPKKKKKNRKKKKRNLEDTKAMNLTDLKIGQESGAGETLKKGSLPLGVEEEEEIVKNKKNLNGMSKSSWKRKRKEKSGKSSINPNELNDLSIESPSNLNESMDISDTKHNLIGSESMKKKKGKKRKFVGKDATIEDDQIPSSVTPKKRKSLCGERKEDLSLEEHLEIKEDISSKLNESSGAKKKKLTLREKMEEKLRGARFRYLNEQLYTSKSADTNKYFLIEPKAFKDYHDGYNQQLNQWPVKPIDLIIKSLKKKPASDVIADFGCGDAQLAQSLPNTVHSFDHVALNKHVTVCDMAKTPLSKGSVDVVVFCLSLMGSNLSDYIAEANRVLKIGGIMKIAEVESRFDDVHKFIKLIGKFGFLCTRKDLSHDYFYLFDFKKEKNIKEGKVLPSLELRACSYKKR